MQELDEWIERVVIDQLYHACTYGPEEAVIEAKQLVKKAIRQKVLESYHNGQAAHVSGHKQKQYARR